MSDTAWQVGSALAIIGASVGFIAGTFRSRRIVTGLVFERDQLDKRNRAQGRRIADMVSQVQQLNFMNNQWSKEEQERQAQREEAARISGEKRHARRLAREAEEAATKAKTHAELIGLVGDTLRVRAATPDGAEPDKQSPASLASLSQGETA